MQVLGDLIELPDDGDLPLPWWHRAPLGMLDGTRVHIALTPREGRPCGDIVVSVIDCTLWKTVRRLDAHAPDRRGVLSSAFGSVEPMNIALAEAATIFQIDAESNGQREHAVTIFCERPHGSNESTSKKKILKNLKPDGFHRVKWTKPPFPKFIWTESKTIEHGWIKNSKWQKELNHHFADTHEVDLSKAVVSADTKQRLLRFVFPRRGAEAFNIVHRDSPGILEQISKVLQESRANILSAILRRGGAEAGDAVLVVVCEPLTVKDTSMRDRVLDSLNSLKRAEPQLRIEATSRKARDCDYSLVFPTHPEYVVAKPPRRMIGQIKDYKYQFTSEKRVPVFISRRFFENAPKVEAIVQEVHQSLRDFGCEPIEAQINTDDGPRSIDEVDARMWACDAGIMLLVQPNDMPSDELISMNVTQEYGFLRGQGKPLLPLFEHGCGDALEKWSNAMGLSSPRFPSNAAAFLPDNKNAIREIIKEWVSQWHQP